MKRNYSNPKGAKNPIFSKGRYAKKKYKCAVIGSILFALQNKYNKVA